MQGPFNNPIASFVLNLIYPAKCPVCERRADGHATSPVCPDCWGRIERLEGQVCRNCAKPLYATGAGICFDCLAHPPAFDIAHCYGPYGGALEKAICTFKFDGIRRLAGPLSGLMGRLPIEGDGIVSVPMTKSDLLRRGFSQTALLARELGIITGKPYMMDALWKVRETKPQVGLSMKQRKDNLKGAFKASVEVKGRAIVLVDDVITTSYTMRECAKELKKAGASRVIAVALARRV